MIYKLITWRIDISLFFQLPDSLEAMRRLQRPAWLLNYKGEGHFVLGRGAQKDWTIRMMQFFDYYLKGTKEPRWMKEGIHLRERGIDQKYDLLKK